MYRNADDLEGIVKKQQKELKEQGKRIEIFNDNLIDVISNIVEFRDLESGQHVKRVKGLTGIMAEACMELFPEFGLTREKIDMIVRASALHDIGKMIIPLKVMNRATRLEDDLFCVEKRFELIAAYYEIDLLHGRITKEEYEQKIKELDEEMAFIY